MKIRNIGVGMRVQVKETCPCYDRETAHEGEVVGFTWSSFGKFRGTIVQVKLDDSDPGFYWECPAGGLRKAPR